MLARLYTQTKYDLLSAMLIIGLIVIIGCGIEESPPPEANAGKNITDAVIGTPIQLDGRKSKSYNDEPLTYRWNIITKPEGSAPLLINDESARPICTPDKAGDYTFTLVVNDGEKSSDPAIVTVNVSIDEESTSGDVGSKDVGIVPGNRISDLSLGQTYEQILNKHGQPDIIDGDVFLYRKGIVGTVPDENKNGKIDKFEPLFMIGAFQPFEGKTAGGNGVDSSIKNFEREFGIPDEIGWPIHFWWRKGISVVEDEGKAEMIFVFLPVLNAAPPAQQRKAQTSFPDLHDLMERMGNLKNDKFE